jgi:hypothetical protein
METLDNLKQQLAIGERDGEIARLTSELFKANGLLAEHLVASHNAKNQELRKRIQEIEAPTKPKGKKNA